MGKTYNIFDATLTIFSGAWAIDNIQSVLGVIIMILTIANILVKMGFKLYDSIKKKKYDKIDDVIEETIDDLKELEDGKNK